MKLNRKTLRKLLLIGFIFLSLIYMLGFLPVKASSINSIILVKTETLQGGVEFTQRTINSNHYSNPAKDRTVFSYTIPSTSDKVKLATWTYSNPYGYEKKTLMDIASDYEKNHPGYIVLGGVNAEGYFAAKSGYYSSYEPTNAIVQDGDVIRKDVSAEVFKNMICLNQDKSWSIKRVPETSENPYLYIYNADGSQKEHLEVLGKNELKDSGLCLLTRDYKGSFDFSGYKVIKGTASLYRISTNFPDRVLNGSNLGIFVKGTLDQVVTEPISTIKDGEFYIVTKSEALFNKLTIGANMKVQFDYLDEFGKVESAIGYMFKYVYNGVVCDDNYQVYLEEEKTYAPKYGSHDYYKSVYKERVGIGFKDNGDIVLMSANTDTGGPCQYEMGEYFLDMGCTNAFQFDGGGSVTFIKRDSKGGFEMLNTPADGVPRTIMTGLFIVMEVADIRVQVTETGSDYVKLNRTIMSDGGSDVSKLYIKIGKSYYPFNGETTLKNLDSFTEYTYELYDAKYKSLNLSGSFKTFKKDIIINQLSVSKNEEGYYVYTLDFDDPDNSLYEVMISVNGQTMKRFSKGVATFTLKNLVCLEDIKIESIVKLDEKNNYERSYSDYVIEYGYEEAMDSCIHKIDDLLNKLFK